MNGRSELNHPWLVAAWPGMGHVAVNAGVYLLAKMGMHLLAELEASDLFDVEQVEVKDGVVRPTRAPRTRLFVWAGPRTGHDLVVLLGEAQPVVGKHAFCKQVIAYAQQLGVERIITFAALATRMTPDDPSRVFGAATDRDGVEQFKRLELEVLEDGNISGLNGVLLGAAAEAGMQGACLLGEMPHALAQLPFPKASLGILEAFSAMTGIDIDLTELADQARRNEEQLVTLLDVMRNAAGEEEEEFEPTTEEPAEEGLASTDRRRIEGLFEEARRERAKAFELKQVLDRLGAFKQYEDRFLDLFKKRR